MQLQIPNDVKTAGDIPFDQRPSCTMREACQATGLSRTTLYERMAAGELKTSTVGRRRLVNVPSLMRLVGADRNKGAARTREHDAS
jgi:excisionase family DNA binding protein